MSSLTVMAPTLPRFTVLPMQPEHYVEAVGTGYPWLDAEQAAWTFTQSGPAFSGHVDGRLAVVAGVAMESPGVGNAWAILTDTGRRHPMFVHRAVVRGIRAIIADYRMTRVTARCVREFYAARRWVHVLGFTKEGTQRRAAPGGGDFTIYALFPEGKA